MAARSHENRSASMWVASVQISTYDLPLQASPATGKHSFSEFFVAEQMPQTGLVASCGGRTLGSPNTEASAGMTKLVMRSMVLRFNSNTWME
jgi:hypothetical protein